MTTVLIWLGSGFAFGAGVFAGVRLVAPGYADKQAEQERRYQDLMRERHAIEREKVELLARIADSFDELELKLRSKQP